MQLAQHTLFVVVTRECIKKADIAGFSIPSRHIKADTIWYIIPLCPHLHNPSPTPSPRHQLALWFMWTLNTMFTYLPNQHSSNAKSHFVKSPSFASTLLQTLFSFNHCRRKEDTWDYFIRFPPCMVFLLRDLWVYVQIRRRNIRKWAKLVGSTSLSGRRHLSPLPHVDSARRSVGATLTLTSKYCTQWLPLTVIVFGNLDVCMVDMLVPFSWEREKKRKGKKDSVGEHLFLCCF